jgi:hypothetical protein
MDHGLIAIARCTGIDTMVQCRLRQQSQGVGLLLQRGRFRGNVARAGVVKGPVRSLILRLASGGERLDQKLADLGLEPAGVVTMPS